MQCLCKNEILFFGEKKNLVSDSCESKNAYPCHPFQMSGSPAESPLRHRWFGTSIVLLLAVQFDREAPV